MVCVVITLLVMALALRDCDFDLIRSIADTYSPEFEFSSIS